MDIILSTNKTIVTFPLLSEQLDESLNLMYH